MCVDATFIPPLRADGTPHYDTPGRALVEAEKEKFRTYHELQDSAHAKLLVVGFEVGGRWSETTVSTLARLAEAKLREAPELLKGQLRSGLLSRWSSLLAVAAQSAYAATLCADGARSFKSAAESLFSWGEL